MELIDSIETLKTETLLTGQKYYYWHSENHIVISVVCVCVCVCKQLPSNQSFDKRVSSHQMGGGVSRWGEWVREATPYRFDTCTL